MTYRDRYEAALRAMPGTAKDIAERLGTTQFSVDRWTWVLRRLGWAHVGGWERCEGPGQMRPILHAGQGVNAPKPKAIPYAESLAAHRQRLKRDKDRYALKCAKEKAHKAIAKIVKSGRKASPFDALGVMAAPERMQKGPYKPRNAEK